jgi:hypothetical protein
LLTKKGSEQKPAVLVAAVDQVSDGALRVAHPAPSSEVSKLSDMELKPSASSSVAARFQRGLVSLLRAAGVVDGDEEPQLAPETLDLIFELSKRAPEEQLRASDAVDSKTFQAFAAASVLIGLAAIHGPSVLVGAATHEPKHDRLEVAFLATAVGAFVLLAVVAIRALWSRTYFVGIGPNQLWNVFWPDTPQTIKHAFVDDIASGYLENNKHLKSKHRSLRFVLIMLLIEASAIGAALIVSAIR